MKQLLLLFTLLVVTIVVAAGLQKGSFRFFTNSLSQQTKPEENKMKIGEKTLTVEIADSAQEHEEGLSGRNSLNKDHGMLFVMTKDSKPTFLMRGMKFPLDIIWINDGKIIGFSENLEPPKGSTGDENLPLYGAPAPVDFVLEVNGGFVKENKITPQTTLELPGSVK